MTELLRSEPHLAVAAVCLGGYPDPGTALLRKADAKEHYAGKTTQFAPEPHYYDLLQVRPRIIMRTFPGVSRAIEQRATSLRIQFA